MPKCGTQCILCDFPVRFDTFSGCRHACEYCFTRRKLDKNIGTEADISSSEGPVSLRSFIEGERKGEVAWVDWDLPIHIGGMSDPYQPEEKEKRRTFECLKILAETKYPFIISTKGRLAVEKEYLDIVSKCNVCFQISLVSPNYDKLEQGAPPFEERIEMIRKISKVVPRLNIRIQPYMVEELNSVMEILLPKIKEAGAYGVTVEGMKAWKGKLPGMEAVGGDMCYPTWLLEEHFLKIKNRAHDIGLGFWSGENRLRFMGDSLGCCGCDDMEGFVGNKYNLNHFYNGENPQPTEAMKKIGTTICFRSLCQAAWCGDVLDQLPFDLMMREIAKSEYGYTTMGLEIDNRKSNTFDIRM